MSDIVVRIKDEGADMIRLITKATKEIYAEVGEEPPLPLTTQIIVENLIAQAIERVVMALPKAFDEAKVIANAQRTNHPNMEEYHFVEIIDE